MRDFLDDFPILCMPEQGKRLVYLDNAATTQRPRQVLEATASFYCQKNANPHRGIYGLAIQAEMAREEARQCAAEFLGAGDKGEVIFTQNTTEAMNIVAYSYGLSHLKPGDEIMLSVLEHHSNLVPWQRIAAMTGASLTYLYPGPDGRISPKEIERNVTPRTKLAAVAHISNVLGTQIPLKTLVDCAHTVGAAVVLDCAQSAAHLRLQVKEWDVDFAAFSGHKLYAPMGIGVLYGKRRLLESMPPFLSGGDMVQSVSKHSASYAPPPRRFEAGTRNVGGEIGLAAAIRYLGEIGWDTISHRERRLTARLLDGLAMEPGVSVYGESTCSEGRFGVVSFNIDGVHPHDVATILDAEGIAIRAGHHCAQPLMDFLGISSCCRASLAVYNTEEDVDALLESVPKVKRRMGIGSGTGIHGNYIGKQPVIQEPASSGTPNGGAGGEESKLRG